MLTDCRMCELLQESLDTMADEVMHQRKTSRVYLERIKNLKREVNDLKCQLAQTKKIES